MGLKKNGANKLDFDSLTPGQAYNLYIQGNRSVYARYLGLTKDGRDAFDVVSYLDFEEGGKRVETRGFFSREAIISSVEVPEIDYEIYLNCPDAPWKQYDGRWGIFDFNQSVREVVVGKVDHMDSFGYRFLPYLRDLKHQRAFDPNSKIIQSTLDESVFYWEEESPLVIPVSNAANIRVTLFDNEKALRSLARQDNLVEERDSEGQIMLIPGSRYAGISKE